MKKYRLKEKLKDYFIVNRNDIQDYDFWVKKGISINALEEVPQRVELKKIKQYDINIISKTKGGFTDQEKDLCEKAFNGELLDIDSIDNDDFDDFAAEYNERNGFDGVSLRLDCYDITELLKQYLKDKQNG